jgi:hypothetical protein
MHSVEQIYAQQVHLGCFIVYFHCASAIIGLIECALRVDHGSQYTHRWCRNRATGDQYTCVFVVYDTAVA